MDKNRSITKMLGEDVSIKDMLPYERFMEKGPEALTDAELLAIIIRTGTSRRTPMEIGSYVLSMCEKYGKGISGIRYLSTLSQSGNCEEPNCIHSPEKLQAPCLGLSSIR